LIGNYIAQDPRVRPLLLLIKKWTKAKGIANTQNSTISSYSWTLLVIHFLLVYKIDRSPILSFVTQADLAHEMTQTQMLDDSAPANSMNLAQLFFSFFIYYGMDQESKIMNSVIQFHPTQKFIRKPTHGQTPLWRLSLIDPLDPTHDLGSCIRRCEGQVFIINQLREIVETFRSFLSTDNDSFEELLQSIFEVNTDVINLPQLCSLCSSDSHLSRSCPEATCFICGQLGHISPDCANKICFRCHQRHHGGLCPTSDNQQENFEISFYQNQADLEVPRCSGEMLLEAVLNWSFSILKGPSLIPKNYRPIPLRFESSIEWFNTFYPFIREDLRYSLKGLIENHGSDDEEIRFLHPLIKVRYRPDDSLLTGTISFDVKDDFEKSFIENKASGLALFIHGKVEGKLEDVLMKTEHFLVHIDYCVDPIEHPLDFKCQFPNKSLLIDLQESNCRNWSLLILGSHLAGVQRVCDALGRRNRPPFMKDILRGKVYEHSIESPENQGPIGDLSSLTLLQTLNASQRLAIQKVLQVGTPHHPRIQIIKGPPGTDDISSNYLSHLA
jgi:hypothetical protein